MAAMRMLLLLSTLAAAVSEDAARPTKISIVQMDVEHTQVAKNCMTMSTPDEASKIASKAAETAAQSEQAALKKIALDTFTATKTRLDATKLADEKLALDTKTGALAAAAATLLDAQKQAHAAAEGKRMHDMEKIIAKKKIMEAEAVEKAKRSMELTTQKHQQSMLTAGNKAENLEDTAMMNNKKAVAIQETAKLSSTKAEYESAMVTYRASMGTIKTAAAAELTTVTNAAVALAAVMKGKRDAKKLAQEKAATDAYDFAVSSAKTAKTNAEAKATLNKEVMEKQAANAVTVAKDTAWVDTITKVMGGSTLCDK